MTRNLRWGVVASLVLLVAMSARLAACGEAPAADDESDREAASQEYERGPHRGRMLRDGDFAVEVTIFEDGVDPQFRLYAFADDKPVAPSDVQAVVELSRLGNTTDRFTFTAENDYLKGDGVVIEPHSFDVRVTASYRRVSHEWRYDSYEGRTVISAEAAASGGITTEQAGPAQLVETIDLSGRLELQSQGEARLRAQYPGRIVAMNGEIGATVNKGDILARVESSESLRTYAIASPITGIVLAVTGTVGSPTTDAPLYVVADMNQLHAEFFIYPRDAARIRAGQKVTVRSLHGDLSTEATIEAILPGEAAMSQAVIAHVPVPYLGGGWLPGMAIEGEVQVAASEVPLAVRTKALQPFRDFTVVFAQVGDTYEVRMLELGRKTPEWSEVLGGLAPGTTYVTDGAFLIRADIEKSGASHDH